MHWLILLLAFLGATGFSAVAQQVAPRVQQTAVIATEEAGFLVFFSNGELLAVAADSLLEVYDVSDLAEPVDAVSVELSAPVEALASAGDFILFAEELDDETGELIVAGPDRYRPEGYGLLNSIAIPAGTTQIAVSPDAGWALVAGPEGYVVARMASADRIQSSAPIPTDDAPIVAVALTNDNALMIRQGQAQLEQKPLSTAISEQVTETALDLPGQATALAVSADSTIAAIALENGDLALVDLETLSISQTLSLGTQSVSDMVFLNQDDRAYLALLPAGESQVLVLDVTDPAESITPAVIELDAEDAINALAANDGLLAVAFESGIHLFQIEPAE